MVACVDFRQGHAGGALQHAWQIGVFVVLPFQPPLEKLLGHGQSLANDAEKVLNGKLAKAVKGEVPYDGGFFQHLANQIQVILDKPLTA